MNPECGLPTTADQKDLGLHLSQQEILFLTLKKLGGKVDEIHDDSHKSTLILQKSGFMGNKSIPFLKPEYKEILTSRSCWLNLCEFLWQSAIVFAKVPSISFNKGSSAETWIKIEAVIR